MTDSIRTKDDFIYRVPTTLRDPSLVESNFDRKRPWTQYIMGYPRFAAFIASDEDRSTTIYRRFERLSSRNLLYLETELAELEASQDQLDAASGVDPDLASSMQSLEELNMLGKWGAETFRRGEKVPGADQKLPQSAHARVRNNRDWFLSEAAQARLQVATRIRVVLKEYYESLKLESDILALSRPDDRTLKGVRKVFKNELDGEEHAPMLAGRMETHLDNEKDLCVLAPPVVRDRLTKLLEGPLAFLFRTRTAEGVTEFVSHTTIATVVSAISSFAAVVFLLGAVLGLYYVHSPDAQLGMLSCLTVAFAGSLGLLTNARRQEIFAATAAYAAVLVVFVSGNLGPNNGNCTCPPT